ncbi:GNAT family N-acetyltransferase [Acrocarpospora catenulata]|uniref:GNAT family N-acetyltransferase n=1 Tax=Acrocarpospora catenulata TaxID=2836182 RepID=UPI001BDB6300|nr:GNAT family N-acetyltransferase [Acrocarpospora catenulata]
MKDFHARAYHADDAAAVAELINVVFQAGGWNAGHTAAEIEDVVNNEVKDPATDTLLITDAEGRLVAAALVPPPPEGGHRIELIGGVHPDRRGAGIGRELLAWQLDRAATRHAETAPDTEWLGQVAAGVADTSASRLYERFGFTVGRYFLQMTAPTTPPPVATPAAGVRIAPYDQAQDRELHAVHTSAFRDLWAHQDRDFESWAALTVRSETFLPDLSRVALANDKIIAYVLPYAHAAPDRLYIGQVGTVDSWRRRGVATSLLADVLGAAGRAGYTHAALDTDADNPTDAADIYAKAGFVIDQHIAVYCKPV